jgi:hypothetical protein
MPSSRAAASSARSAKSMARLHPKRTGLVHSVVGVRREKFSLCRQASPSPLSSAVGAESIWIRKSDLEEHRNCRDASAAGVRPPRKQRTPANGESLKWIGEGSTHWRGAHSLIGRVPMGDERRTRRSCWCALRSRLERLAAQSRTQRQPSE